jgi:hypothetical protein
MNPSNILSKDLSHIVRESIGIIEAMLDEVIIVLFSIESQHPSIID